MGVNPYESPQEADEDPREPDGTILSLTKSDWITLLLLVFAMSGGAIAGIVAGLSRRL
jgi:hypothetical protein